MLPPPFLRPGQVHAVPIDGFAPSTPGRYVLRVSADGERLIERRVQVRPVEPAAFDGSADGMQASLSLRTPARFAATPAELLTLHVDAINIGRTSWNDEANIRLGWRWWKVQRGRKRESSSQNTRAALPLFRVISSVPTSRQGAGMRSRGTSEHLTSPDAMSCAFPC